MCFGGGTRIALELDEYRESVDIDSLCPNKDAYRAVREQVTNTSLGALVRQEFEYVREIRADRYAVRTFLKLGNTLVKLGIVSCDEYRLVAGADPNLFPLPYLSRESCFMTKLLANADRALAPPFKDVFDLVAMTLAWGEIPPAAWQEAERQYGSVPRKALRTSLEDMLTRPALYLEWAADMKMKPDWAQRIVTEGAQRLHSVT
ncbi:nucleotidyl transferase AbiEii/AbiGii toxin family protein [Thiothrix nivea]|uniref:nucleotidyl transferase AbiEii/AbiGii toxin family protein n=1 Tax=Thiothrix nivea TaxID=1031 RepID=UPI0009DB0582|nr:nucleotidyl transferase AbiEii/AbiGii toxin family protein [Thiothrix nivea]